MASDGAFLSVGGIHKRFGGVHALRGADLAVRRAEVHSLVGANGSGKSTLLNILSGQVAPDAGTIVLDGAPQPAAKKRMLRIASGCATRACLRLACPQPRTSCCWAVSRPANTSTC